MTSPPPVILTVEDAFLVGLQLKRDLEVLGFEVIGPASTVPEALELIDHPSLAMAILDINLGSENSMPIAEALRERNIPFLFISGYDSVVTDPFDKIVILRKPSTPAKIAEAISSVIPLPK
jgi:two-component SAPR family response regulator